MNGLIHVRYFFQRKEISLAAHIGGAFCWFRSLKKFLLESFKLDFMNTLSELFLLPESQCRFRRDRGTLDMIFSFRLALEMASSKQYPFHVLFFKWDVRGPGFDKCGDD